MEPLVFAPYLRPQVWGGRNLERLFHKRLPDEKTYGESWEISGHAHHISQVAEGPLQGALLTDLCREHAQEIYGFSPSVDRFPLLIKLLDCHETLSIQVHPNNEMAEKLIGNELGKTEAWIILHAEPEGTIYAGLKPGVTKEVLQQHLEAGTTNECLHAFHPQPGDCVFIPAGTVHAVGQGVVMAEVQQSSDATFRLFDWNRVGLDGKPRQLHQEESLASIDWQAGPVHPARPTIVDRAEDDIRVERLADCPYFRLERFQTSGELPNPYAGRFSIWMVLDGSADLTSRDNYQRSFQQGETVLIPASSPPTQWQAEEATLLGVTLPKGC